MDAKELFSKVNLDSWQTVLQQIGRLIIAQKNDEIRELRNAGAKNISIPFWEDEFRAFRNANKEQIAELEKKRLVNKYDRKTIERAYLDSKISDFQFLQMPLRANHRNEVLVALARQGMQVQETDIPLSTDVCCIMRNITIEYHSDDYHNHEQWELNVKEPFLWCKTDLYPANVYLEIDRQIPQWLDEAKTLLREFDKRDKIERLNTNSVKALVKNKMRELGCEYKFYEKVRSRDPLSDRIQKDSFLEIKLQKSRKFTIKLPNDSVEKTRKILDALAGYISAINNLPMNFRISNLRVGGEQWEKEEETKI